MRAPVPECLRIELADFEAANVTAGDFDHEAHVRVAWTMLQTVELNECLSRYPRALRRITQRFGVPHKFHATLTGCLLLLIAERRAAMPGLDWRAFRAANPDLLTRTGVLLERYYTRSRLTGELARRQFLLPDRSAIGRGANSAT